MGDGVLVGKCVQVGSETTDAARHEERAEEPFELERYGGLYACPVKFFVLMDRLAKVRKKSFES